MKSSPKITLSRLEQRIEEMAMIGAREDGGVNRLALSDDDRAGRDLFIEWCKEVGCEVRIDEIGNIFARKEGTNPDLPTVLFGSHLDSQPTGGKFDGAMGVLSGLEVIETIRDLKISHDHSLEVVSWTNEEGARFSPAMLGSGFFSNEFDAEYAFSRKDSEGKRIDEELKRIGYKGIQISPRPNYKAYFEIHLEQGPVLEHSGVDLGVVTGVQGIRWYDVFVHGTETHAGPTPMIMRDDPVQKTIQLHSKIFELAETYSPQGRVTIGSIQTKPGVRNTVPGSVLFTVDIRHPENSALNQMHKDLEQICNSSKVLLTDIWHSPPVLFHDKCAEIIDKSAEALGISRQPIVSGAGHDAVYVNQVIPSGMIFTPCKNGISHHPEEFVEPSHIEAAANVLLHSVLQTAKKEFII